MKKIIVIILGVITLAGHAKADSPVCPDPVTLSCMKKDFATFYRKDYDRFFESFHKFEKEASSCKKLKATTEFLGLVTHIKGNAEVGEAFAEAIEKMIVRSPRCFLDASASLTDSSQGTPEGTLLSIFLLTPFLWMIHSAYATLSKT